MTYNGEEIGMTDTYISWERTVDPLGCLAGKAEYELKSRDPYRTPFQWNNSVAAGKFTTRYNFHADDAIFGFHLFIENMSITSLI